MDGVIPYSCVRLKYPCEVYWNPWSLWSCNSAATLFFAEIRRSRKWVQMGQQMHKYENLLNRDFHADAPNQKWVTDISYIHTDEGVIYLSMIRDLYDNSIVAYKTAVQQTVSLVLDTIRLAMKDEKKRVAAELQLHSDQGFQPGCYTFSSLAALFWGCGGSPASLTTATSFGNHRSACISLAVTEEAYTSSCHAFKVLYK